MTSGGMQRSVCMVACATGCALAAPSGCSPQTRVPATGPHTDADAPVTVSSPPPEVRVEAIPANSDPAKVWVDGYWTWRGRGWSWHPGAWTLPPAHGYYAPPLLVHLPVAVFAPLEAGVSADAELEGYAMQLLFIAGHWHDKNGAIVEESQTPGPAPAPTQSADP
jgi:hypothetical protein